jgi:hypothetical protein
MVRGVRFVALVSFETLSVWWLLGEVRLSNLPRLPNHSRQWITQ